MQYLIYFTIYFIITSLIGYYANRPKIKIIKNRHISIPEVESITAVLTVNQLKRFNGAMVKLGSVVIESDKAIIKLKTVMDKVCDENNKS